jgi:hypothetical protein
MEHYNSNILGLRCSTMTLLQLNARLGSMGVFKINMYDRVVNILFINKDDLYDHFDDIEHFKQGLQCSYFQNKPLTKNPTCTGTLLAKRSLFAFRNHEADFLRGFEFSVAENIQAEWQEAVASRKTAVLYATMERNTVLAIATPKLK